MALVACLCIKLHGRSPPPRHLKFLTKKEVVGGGRCATCDKRSQIGFSVKSQVSPKAVRRPFSRGDSSPRHNVT